MPRPLASLLTLLVALLALVPAAPATAAVDDFEFESFTADYFLDRDENGRSLLRVVETLVAVFPEVDQNRGIRRVFIDSYDGHPTGLEVESVTDESGAPREWEIEDTDDGDLVSLVSAGDDYVHGRQTYVITYTQRDVTRFFGDTGADEFYWDTNGDGWRQPFGELTARVHLSEELAAELTGETACYQGPFGATDPCAGVERRQEGDEVVLEARSQGALAPGENVTIAVGFEQGTFVPRDESYLGSWLAWLQLALLGAVLGAVGYAVWHRTTRLRDAPGRPTIITEYSRPEGADLFTAAVVIGRSRRAVAATLVDLAVRRILRIVDNASSSSHGGKGYTVEVAGDGEVSPAERRLMKALFPGGAHPGAFRPIVKNDTALGRRMVPLMKGVVNQTDAQGWRRKQSAAVPVLLVLVAGIAAVGAFVVGLFLLEDQRGGVWPALMWVPLPLAIVAIIILTAHTPLTARGAELRDHLEGMKRYIRLAEQDRLAMLQSPQGAERSAVAPGDRGAIVRLYEDMLPFAVLFGLEKQWAEVLGTWYGDEPPEWYSGSGSFSAAAFASSVGSLSSTAASAYSGSSSSSSSGGSSGGGSSGGGGGGGGGGGV